MPEIRTIETKARSIQKGDIVILPGSEIETSPITVISEKTKYIWIDGEDGTKGRLGVNETVKVKRSFPTEEEINEHRRENFLKDAKNALDTYEETFEKSRKEYTEKVMSDYGIDHWEVEKFYGQQAEYRLWREIATVIRKRAEADNPITIEEVFQYTLDRIMNDLTNIRLSDSRSTSGWSNICDDKEMQVRLNWMKRWGGWRSPLAPQINKDRMI